MATAKRIKQLDDMLTKLIRKRQHFGAAGSSVFFMRSSYWTYLQDERENGGFEFTMWWLNVIYSAMTHTGQHGDVISQLRYIPGLAREAHKTVRHLQKMVPDLYDRIGTGDAHILMSTALRVLEIFK
jgi:hypothetical protein